MSESKTPLTDAWVSRRSDKSIALDAPEFLRRLENDRAELIEALQKELKLRNTIEVLGEYSALDINLGEQKRMRAKVDEAFHAHRDLLARLKVKP